MNYGVMAAGGTSKGGNRVAGMLGKTIEGTIRDCLNVDKNLTRIMLRHLEDGSVHDCILREGEWRRLERGERMTPDLICSAIYTCGKSQELFFVPARRDNVEIYNWYTIRLKSKDEERFRPSLLIIGNYFLHGELCGFTPDKAVWRMDLSHFVNENDPKFFSPQSAIEAVIEKLESKESNFDITKIIYHGHDDLPPERLGFRDNPIYNPKWELIKGYPYPTTDDLKTSAKLEDLEYKKVCSIHMIANLGLGRLTKEEVEAKYGLKPGEDIREKWMELTGNTSYKSTLRVFDLYEESLIKKI